MITRIVSYFRNRNPEEFDIEAQENQLLLADEENGIDNEDEILFVEEDETLPDQNLALSNTHQTESIASSTSKKMLKKQKVDKALRELSICKEIITKLNKIAETQLQCHHSTPFLSGLIGITLPIMGGTIYGLNKYFITNPLNQIIQSDYWPTLGPMVVSFFRGWTPYCAPDLSDASCGMIFPDFITNFF